MNYNFCILVSLLASIFFCVLMAMTGIIFGMGLLVKIFALLICMCVLIGLVFLCFDNYELGGDLK